MDKKIEEIKISQVQNYLLRNIFLNPQFRPIAENYLPMNADDLILHDEFTPDGSFLEIKVTRTRLKRLMQDWEGEDVAIFASVVLRSLQNSDITELRVLVESLSAAERFSVVRGLTHVMWKGAILSAEDASKDPEIRDQTKTLEGCENLPILEKTTWNLLTQLELFFERYTRDADAPVVFEKDFFVFYLPPLPMKTAARMGFMSATLDKDLFFRAFDTRMQKRGDVSFHSTGLTDLHEGAKICQLKTNKNPRDTVLNPMAEREDKGLLSKTGQYFWDLVAEDLKKPNRGLITYKEILKEKADFLDGIPTANFGGLVGLDTRFKDVQVLHILFSPEIPPAAVALKAKLLYGNDADPLNYERDPSCGYKDERVQRCYESGVKSELLQAGGRLRLVNFGGLVVIWTSHYLEGVTDRDQCFLFSEKEWELARGDFERLVEVIRETDVKVISEASGVSERTAYRIKETERRKEKTELQEKAVRLFDKGIDMSTIAKIVGKNKSTISRWLAKLKF